MLLSTAKVDLLDEYGSLQEARVLLDSCSQANFITLDYCRRLKLKVVRRPFSVHGIGSTSSPVHGAVQIVVVSKLDNSKRYPLEFLVVDKIADPLPQTKINTTALSHFHNLPLADPNFGIPGPIDGIVGAALFPYLIGQKRVDSGKNMPVAIETSLGFVVMGLVPIHSSSENYHSFCTILEPSLESLVKHFWTVEDVPSQSFTDPDDLECEKLFKLSCHRDSTGRYTVALPFKLNISQLGDSYSTAYRRFLSLENRLLKNSNLRDAYIDIINDYLAQGHMSKIENAKESTSPCYYIPHHAVFKTDSQSTPVRIVFDASCKTDTNCSLNDLLHIGPKLQSDLFSLLLNFRMGEVAFSADIRQMYRQINLVENHRCFQRILWRSSPNNPVEAYELNTVSFGVKSSPFLALRTVQQLAEDEKMSLPLGSEIVKRDMYIDDVVSSVDSINHAVIAYDQLIELFRRGGFQLTKWASNSKQFLDSIPVENRSAKVVDFEVDSFKILGLQWHPNTDSFSFTLNLLDRTCTKRNILSTVASCFDPLGLLAPVTLLAKLIIKELWILHLDWDEVPPDNIVHNWNTFQEGLHLLSNFKIPRHLNTTDKQSVTLIGFSDACLTSYGAVVYLRSV